MAGFLYLQFQTVVSMNRDGATISIWQDQIKAHVPANPWEKNTRYDVLIVGGGITGLTTALLLQQKGKKCILAEAHNIGFGTTGGTTAHLNTLLDAPYYELEKSFGREDAQLVAKGAREAIARIETISRNCNIDCDLEYKTAYLYAETDDEAAELEKIKDGNEHAGVTTEWSNSIPVPVPFTRALSIGGQGQLHAGKYIAGLAKAFEEVGGVILQHCLVSKVTGDEEILADTCLGAIKAGACVYATHLPPGINIFSFRCAPYRSYAVAFTLKTGDYPSGLAYDSKDPYHYFRSHNVNGQDYVIAGGMDHKTGHCDNTEHVFTELEAYLKKYFDIDKVAYKWSSQYYNSVDGLPYIGLMPGHDHVYAATGYGGNGIIYGTLAGTILCDLICGQASPYAEVFDPSRIKVAAGFSSFIKENADVVSNFVSKRINIDKLKQLADLAPGEGKIVIWENNKVALYKDEHGHIYAVDPVCPHARCIVSWNNAEKTWDCPCHGARYAPNGDLLSGPASKGLTQVKQEDLEGD